jgi:hypothetical protein
MLYTEPEPYFLLVQWVMSGVGMQGNTFIRTALSPATVKLVSFNEKTEYRTAAQDDPTEANLSHFTSRLSGSK